MYDILFSQKKIKYKNIYNMTEFFKLYKHVFEQYFLKDLEWWTKSYQWFSLDIWKFYLIHSFLYFLHGFVLFTIEGSSFILREN